MTVETVQQVPTAIAEFQVNPVTVPAQLPATVPPKLPKRSMWKRAQRAMLPAHIAISLAAVALTSVTSALVFSGMAASTVEKHRAATAAQVDGILRERTALATRESDVAGREKRLTEAQAGFESAVTTAVAAALEKHRSSMAADRDALEAERGTFKVQLEAMLKPNNDSYNTSARLLALRTTLNAMTPAEQAELATLAAKAAARDIGFVLDSSQYATYPNTVQIKPEDVARMLATNGRLFVGRTHTLHYSHGPEKTLRSTSTAEIISTFEGLRTYLTMFRNAPN